MVHLISVLVQWIQIDPFHSQASPSPTDNTYHFQRRLTAVKLNFDHFVNVIQQERKYAIKSIPLRYLDVTVSREDEALLVPLDYYA